jgi:hypothetical protein
MNLPTILVLLLLISLYALAIRYVRRNKSACTDCGLSGACPIKDLRKNAMNRQCAVAAEAKQKPTLSELKMMIRKE